MLKLNYSKLYFLQAELRQQYLYHLLKKKGPLAILIIKMFSTKKKGVLVQLTRYSDKI